MEHFTAPLHPPPIKNVKRHKCSSNVQGKPGQVHSLPACPGERNANHVPKHSAVSSDLSNYPTGQSALQRIHAIELFTFDLHLERLISYGIALIINQQRLQYSKHKKSLITYNYLTVTYLSDLKTFLSIVFTFF